MSTDNQRNAGTIDHTVHGSRGARRRWFGILGGATLVALATWAALSSRGATGENGAPNGATATMPGMAGADGMAGMDMGAGGMAGMNMSADGTVRLSQSQIRQFGITFGTAEIRVLQDRIRATGVVNFDETRVAQVTPKFGGFIEQLHVAFTGQPVRQGDPLLEIYSPELVAAQEELLVAQRLERTMDQSVVPGVPAGTSNLVATATRRLRLWDISEEQIEQILRSGAVRRSLTLHAPSSGVVTRKDVVRGQSVQPGHTLYVIADLSVVWVEVELRESEAGGVREGTAASLEFAAMPGRSFVGRVQYVYPTLQASSRTIKARIALPNAAGRIKPGMYATVRLTTPRRSALTIPASAAMRTGERVIVFVDMGEGELMPHEVVLGQVGAEFVEVLSGVESGHRVVTSAQYLLDSESSLAEVMKSMIGMGGGGEMQGMGMPRTPPASATPQR